MAKRTPTIKPHIHGCGHPVRPVVTCGDPLCLLGSGWLDWNDEHEEAKAKGKKCICYFCWKEKREAEDART